MNILLTVPTRYEAQYLPLKKIKVAKFITGMGNIPTYISLTELIKEKKKPKLIIQIGLAGSYHRSFKIGEVVLVKEDCMADLGIYDNYRKFKPLHQLNFKNSLPKFMQKKYISNPFLKYFTSLEPSIVRAATVQKPPISIKDINEIRNNFSPDIESMEGVAFHCFGLNYNIPFIQIRAISNKVEPMSKRENRFSFALKKLNGFIEEKWDNLSSIDF